KEKTMNVFTASICLLAGCPLFAGPGFNQTTIPTGHVGTPYTLTFSVSGGRQPYKFAVTSGALPSGSPVFNLSSDGILTGTPNGCSVFPAKNCAKTEPMTSSFTVTATDRTGVKILKAFVLKVYWNPTKDQYMFGLRSAMQAIDTEVMGIPVPHIKIA